MTNASKPQAPSPKSQTPDSKLPTNTMRRKKQTERITLQNIEITEAAAEGKAVARHDNMVIFVSNAVPGDVCDILITRNKKSFMEGRATVFHTLSDKRPFHRSYQT